MPNDTESTTNNRIGLWQCQELMNRITSGVHRTGGQFYDLYVYVGPGRLVLYWYPVYADERQRQTNKSAPFRAIRRPLMRARRHELKPRAGRRTVRGARRGAYPKTPGQNTVSWYMTQNLPVTFSMITM